MSQHADIAKHCLALAIKKGFTKEECLDNLNGTFCAAGYEEDAECPEHELKLWIERILLSQKDGLYGVSHAEVNEWMKKELC